MAVEMGDVAVQSGRAAMEDHSPQAQADFYAKLAKLEDEILAGTHPRIQLPPNLLARLTSSSGFNKYAAPYDPDAPSETVDGSQGYGVGNGGAALHDSPARHGYARFESTGLGGSNARVETFALTKSDQLRIAEIRLERQKIESSLMQAVEKNRKKIAQSKRAGFSDSFDSPQSYDVTSLLNEARATIAHVSGVHAKASTRDSMESSPFDDGYYSSLVNSPWSSDKSPKAVAEEIVPAVQTVSDAVELESEPMDIDDQAHFDKDSNNDGGEMDIDEGGSVGRPQSDESISSGDRYSPEPYQPQSSGAGFVDKTTLQQTRRDEQSDVGRDESYSPPSADALGTGTASGEDIAAPQTHSYGAGWYGGSNEVSEMYDVQQTNTARADRSESYSPPLPDSTPGGAVQSHVQHEASWTRPTVGTTSSLINVGQAGIHGNLPQTLFPTMPSRVLTMEEIQNLAQASAQALGESQQVQHSQQPPQPANSSSGNNNSSRKKTSKRVKRAKQNNQNAQSASATAVSDSPRHKSRNKRNNMDEFPSNQHLPPQKKVANSRPSPEPYIKPEPVSPPPFNEAATERDQPRRRVVQYADGRVEIEPYNSMNRSSRVRRPPDSIISPDDLVPVTGYRSQTPVRRGRPPQEIFLDSARSSPAMHAVRRDGTDLRRVASLQYASRAQSPPEQYWHDGTQYVKAVRQQPVRQGSYLVDGGRSMSSHFDTSPTSSNFRNEVFDTQDVYVQPPIQPPRRKIIIDEDGNEYIAVLRNSAPQPSPQPFRDMSYTDGRASQSQVPSYNEQFVRSRSVYGRPQSTRPPPRVIELSDDDDYQTMPPPRLPMSARPRQPEFAEPLNRRSGAYQAQTGVRAVSLQPGAQPRPVSLQPQHGMGSSRVVEHRRVSSGMMGHQIIPEHVWASPHPGPIQPRERALSAMPNTTRYVDPYGVPEFDSSQPRYRMY